MLSTVNTALSLMSLNDCSWIDAKESTLAPNDGRKRPLLLACGGLVSKLDHISQYGILVCQEDPFSTCLWADHVRLWPHQGQCALVLCMNGSLKE
jgi:hypothetical protein